MIADTRPIKVPRLAGFGENAVQSNGFGARCRETRWVIEGNAAMSARVDRTAGSLVEYPESDGNPMAENTLQFEWIVTIKEGLEALYSGREDVFVAGDLLWYPVEGDPKTRAAPDAMVAIGRPKGHRGSYLQWEEGGIAPQVVFEVLSPGNTVEEMRRKREYYERHGVLEYDEYDPVSNAARGWSREGVVEAFREVREMEGWTSPLLGVRFELGEGVLRLYGPDGRRFSTYQELYEDSRRLELERRRVRLERRRVRVERRRAERERERAETEHQRAEAERARAEKLAEKLREMRIDPDA